MDGNIYTHEVGKGLPILIIHGWETNGKVEELDFEPILSKTPGIRRIYVDPPGMGKTPAEDIRTSDDIFDRISQSIDARLPKLRFLVAGSSYGGHVARALAIKYQDRVDGLLLRVPLVEPENSRRDLDAFEALVKNDKVIEDLPPQDKKLLEEILVETPEYIKALKTKYEEAYIPAQRTNDSKLLNSIRTDSNRYSLSETRRKDTEKFAAPTLIVCGRQDTVVGYRDALRLLELCPRSTFAILDRETHALPVGKPSGDVFAALVADWIFRVREWQDKRLSS